MYMIYDFEAVFSQRIELAMEVIFHDKITWTINFDVIIEYNQHGNNTDLQVIHLYECGYRISSNLFWSVYMKLYFARQLNMLKLLSRLIIYDKITCTITFIVNISIDTMHRILQNSH